MNASAKTPNHNGTHKLTRDGAVKEKNYAFKDLRQLFVKTLTDIYFSEKILSHTIPKVIKNATSEELHSTLFEYKEYTHRHLLRLDKIFSSMDIKPTTKRYDVLFDLIKESESVMEEKGMGVMRDTAIIIELQKVMHYKIAIYGTLFSFAKTLDENDTANLLFLSLDDEKEVDEMLTNIAESTINFLALMEMLKS